MARKLVAAGKRDRALLALKKKRAAEHQQAQVQAWLLNVEDMVRAVVCLCLRSGERAGVFVLRATRRRC